jgi:hypothetical protein
LETRKTPSINSDDGGDKDPMKKNIEKFHVVHTSAKRKREIHKMGLEIPEIQESHQAMDVDEIIEEPICLEQRLMETQEILEAHVIQEPKIFEEESVTLHHMTYNRNSKKVLIEKVNTKKKSV